MIRRALARFALLALVPAALNIGLPAGAATITVPLCTGDGTLQVVEVPAGGQRAPGQDPSGCCQKGCHGPCSRKRGAKPDAEPCH